jgi:hypothetical protein
MIGGPSGGILGRTSKEPERQGGEQRDTGEYDHGNRPRCAYPPVKDTRRAQQQGAGPQARTQQVDEGEQP